MAFTNWRLYHVSRSKGMHESDLTASGPFRATLFRLILSMVSSLIEVLPSFSWGVTSTGSHLTGAFDPLVDARIIGFHGSTLAAAKISLTDWEISGPIPSPSIKLTV